MILFAVLAGEVAVPCSLKSAVAGVICALRELADIVCPWNRVVRDRSCAIACCEPCQAGNRAALSGVGCVPQPTGFESAFAETGCLWLSMRNVR